MATSGYQYPQSDFAKKHYGEGKLEGRQKSLLRFLAARSFVIDSATRARIEQCTDPAQLDQWIDRAATASSLDDIFRH